MEEKNPKIGKFALNYGVLTGVVLLVFGIMLFAMNMHYDQTAGIQVTNILILVAGIIFGIVQFKKANGGLLAISEALKVGTGVALISAIIGLLYFFLLSNVIEPDYMDKVFEIGKIKALNDNPNLTEEQIDQGIEMQKGLTWIYYPIGLIMNVVIGLVIGLITGLILKKEEAAY